MGSSTQSLRNAPSRAGARDTAERQDRARATWERIRRLAEDGVASFTITLEDERDAFTVVSRQKKGGGLFSCNR